MGGIIHVVQLQFKSDVSSEKIDNVRPSILVVMIYIHNY